MSKYIDVEKLKTEIENLEPFTCISEVEDGFYSAVSRINDIIDYLQQVQPEVDLEKELNRYLRGEFQQTAGGNFNNYIQVARHFYELGKKAK